MPLILCSGMNRAGSTLQYNIVRMLLEKTDRGRGEGFLLGEEIGAKKSDIEAWATENQWHVLKSHQLLPNTAEMMTAGKLHLCYIYRDIRGVAASYKRIWQVDEQKLLAELDAAVQHYEAVSGLKHNVLWQRYENLVQNLAAGVRETADFLKLDASPEIIAQVAESCSIASMKQVMGQLDRKLQRQKIHSLARRVIRRLGLTMSLRHQPPTSRKRQIDQLTLLHPNHISGADGSPDSWHSQLSESEIKWLTDRYYDWLVVNGYLQPNTQLQQ